MVLAAVAAILALLLVAMAMTKPDKMAHYGRVKAEALKVVDHQIVSRPELAEFAAIGTVKAMEAADAYLGRNLLVYEHTFYNEGVLLYNDYMVTVSIGVLGQVFLTVAHEDLERAINSTELMKMMGVESIDDVKRWIETNMY